MLQSFSRNASELADPTTDTEAACNEPSTQDLFGNAFTADQLACVESGPATESKGLSDLPWWAADKDESTDAEDSQLNLYLDNISTLLTMMLVAQVSAITNDVAAAIAPLEPPTIEESLLRLAIDSAIAGAASALASIVAGPLAGGVAAAVHKSVVDAIKQTAKDVAHSIDLGLADGRPSTIAFVKAQRDAVLAANIVAALMFNAERQKLAAAPDGLAQAKSFEAAMHLAAGQAVSVQTTASCSAWTCCVAQSTLGLANPEDPEAGTELSQALADGGAVDGVLSLYLAGTDPALGLGLKAARLPGVGAVVRATIAGQRVEQMKVPWIATGTVFLNGSFPCPIPELTGAMGEFTLAVNEAGLASFGVADLATLLFLHQRYHGPDDPDSIDPTTPETLEAERQELLAALSFEISLNTIEADFLGA